MSKSETVCIAYSGKTVDTGEMDINYLAPALLAFSDLISESNKILNHDNSKIQVYIKSNFQRGSFEIELAAIRSISETIKSLFQSNAVEIGELLNIIGIGASISGVNLMEIIKWIRGRKIKNVTVIDKDTVKIEIDKEEREISIGAFKLLKSRKIREHIKGLLSPLKKDGIDAFEIRDKEKHETVRQIKKEETDFFCADIDCEIQENISIKTGLVHIINLNFEEGLKWRFDDGGTKFYATIKDEDFIKNVQEGNIAFKKSDILEVEIKSTQFTDGINLKTTFEILKVKRIISENE